MSKSPWNRCQRTNLPLGKLDGLEPPVVDDRGLVTACWKDCDLFVVSSISAAAGFANPTRGLAALRDDPRFHRHEVRDADGHLVTMATHTTSVAWLGRLIRAERRSRLPSAIGLPAMTDCR